DRGASALRTRAPPGGRSAMNGAGPRADVERFVSAGTDAGALARFARARGMDPRDARVSVADAVRQLLVVDPALALRGARRLAHLTRAERDPRWNADVQRLRAHALRASGRIEEAARAYERAHARFAACDPAAADLTVI